MSTFGSEKKFSLSKSQHNYLDIMKTTVFVVSFGKKWLKGFNL